MFSAFLNNIFTHFTGLEELTKLDPKFAQYRESLFSQASTSLHRDQQTPDVLRQIDETITSFLFLLTEFYLTPGAFKALEYLIRRYR
jgi:U3 small nucleolar RNA-associated protein 10